MSSKLESDVCCRLQVAPSGESYEGKRRPGRLLLGIWRDSRHVTCGLTACTPGSAPGPTLGNEYGKTLPFLILHKCCRLVVYNRSCSVPPTAAVHSNELGDAGALFANNRGCRNAAPWRPEAL